MISIHANGDTTMTDEIFDIPDARRRDADDDIRDHVYYRNLAKAEYEQDRTDEAIVSFMFAYAAAVNVLGHAPAAAEELAQKAKSAFGDFDDDNAYDYYKAAYNIIVKNIEFPVKDL